MKDYAVIVSLVTAAAAQCVVSTAWSMVVSVAAVRAGETVLVPSASGGVAGAAVQTARNAAALAEVAEAARRGLNRGGPPPAGGPSHP